jgi:hypothetical protein
LSKEPDYVTFEEGKRLSKMLCAIFVELFQKPDNNSDFQVDIHRLGLHTMETANLKISGSLSNNEVGDNSPYA